MADEYGCKCHCSTFREHIGNGPYIASAARPTRAGSAGVHQANIGEKYMNRDKATYKLLREQGIQPEKLRGIHEIATKAKDVMEIEHGENMSQKMINTTKRVNEASSEVATNRGKIGTNA